KLPEATFEEGSGLVKATEELSVTLKLQRIPYSVTIALFDGQYLLVDPTEVEESITSEQITIVFDEVGQLCSIWKVGGLPCSPEHLKQCMNVARERYKQISMI
ncbi:10924_t:CDS:2, partial [Dentiscutata heterogama]